MKPRHWILFSAFAFTIAAALTSGCGESHGPVADDASVPAFDLTSQAQTFAAEFVFAPAPESDPSCDGIQNTKDLRSACEFHGGVLLTTETDESYDLLCADPVAFTFLKLEPDGLGKFSVYGDDQVCVYLVAPSLP